MSSINARFVRTVILAAVGFGGAGLLTLGAAA